MDESVINVYVAVGPILFSFWMFAQLLDLFFLVKYDDLFNRKTQRKWFESVNIIRVFFTDACSNIFMSLHKFHSSRLITLIYISLLSNGRLDIFLFPSVKQKKTSNRNRPQGDVYRWKCRTVLVGSNFHQFCPILALIFFSSKSFCPTLFCPIR